MPSKHEALNSNPSTVKTNKQKEKEEMDKLKDSLKGVRNNGRDKTYSRYTVQDYHNKILSYY
jgi:hypothetical protein